MLCLKGFWTIFLLGVPNVLEVLRSAPNEVVAGAPNENIVRNHLNIALLNVF